jgi:hypothetical protein
MHMARWIWPVSALTGLTVLVSGCGGDAEPVAVPTVTTTATATATVTVTATPKTIVIRPETTAGVAPEAEPSQTAPGGRIRLTVFTDGCGVIRSDTRPDEYRNLTWVFRDLDGFQVFGGNAEGQTRYRYFQGGTYTVAVEAWAGSHYAPVSNTVTVHC